MKPSILLLAVFLVCSCGGRDIPLPLTVSQLQNAEYRSEWTGRGTVTLVDGRYLEEIIPGAASRLSIAIVPGAYSIGDLNGDGAEDAVVVLAASGGGSGTFITLEVVVNDQGTPRHATGVELGDRVTIHTLGISQGVITVSMWTHQRTDPKASAGVNETRWYRFESGELETVR